MRSLTELIDLKEPGWPLVKHWLAAANKPVEVLPRDPVAAEATLQALQVTTRSPLGAVAYESGGLLIDHGWVRVLGSGAAKMRGSLMSWNGLGGHAAVEPMEGVLLVAHDAVGGFFALDGGGLGGERPGGAYYFAPDTLRWEEMGFGYSGLLEFLFSGDVAQYYKHLRWPGWEAESDALSPDSGFHLYPPPFSAEGKDVSKVSKRAVLMEELLRLQLTTARQLQG